jgi:hypothetical protein
MNRTINALLLILLLPLYAASAEGEAAPHTPVSFFFTAGPQLMVNTEPATKSAPSPVQFSGGIGAIFFQDTRIQLLPQLSFFTGYYLWDGTNALPAEVENRTALALSFLIDVPVMYTWKKNSWTLRAGGGISILPRIGIRAPGVSSTEAGDDISSINSWFWSGARFLYPELTASAVYKTSGGWHTGIQQKFYIPAGSLIAGRGLDAAIISSSIILVLPR